jgi:GMP synthase-like glutamine amidotransferase
MNYIQKVIDSNKLVLGICLGAQLLAENIGGRVIRMENREYGWWPIEWDPTNDFLPSIPRSFMAFQSHQNTFTLPADGQRLAFNRAASNQVFVYQNRIVGLQFHPEMTESAIQSLAKDISWKKEERFFQPPDQWLPQKDYMNQAKTVLFCILDKMEEIFLSQQKGKVI